MYTDLQSVASPLGHSTRKHCSPLGLGETRSERTTGFEPATLTPGKVMLYQLSHVRASCNHRLRCDQKP